MKAGLDWTGGRGVDAIDAIRPEATGSRAACLLQTFSQARRATLHQAMAECNATEPTNSRRLPAQCRSSPRRPVRQADRHPHGSGQRAPLNNKILPLLTDEDPLGVDDLVTHTMLLDEAPRGYKLFQQKENRCVKLMLQPYGGQRANMIALQGLRPEAIRGS
jgi:hypothetical protein